MRILFFFVSIAFLNAISADMNFICDNIYLGDKRASSNENYLKQHNISAVVNCAISVVSKYNEIKVLELQLYDKSWEKLFPKLEVAYKFIKKNSKNNILIHCSQGRSRSASLVVFYLMKEKGWNYDTCIKFIKEKRPSVRPNSGFVNQLKEYYNNYIKK